jgi:hypothetical protein
MSNPENSLIIGPDEDSFNTLLHNDKSKYFHPEDWEDGIKEELDGKGWHFGAGDPEYWKFSGSSSLFFALNGMEVVGIEPNQNSVIALNSMAKTVQQTLPEFKMKVLEADAIEDALPAGEFDVVILGYLIHLPNQEATYKVFDKALAALKPGGHIWVRGAGKHSSGYEDLLYQSPRPSFYGQGEVWAESEDVIWMPCGCSGEMRIEPTVFFDPLDFNKYFSEAGCKIVHSQTIERYGAPNIMYGENFRPDADHGRTGMISVLAQKPLE